MTQENSICICMGSSCFARGNQRNVDIAEQFILERGLNAAIEFTGSHCEKRCSEGPNITINGVIYKKIEGEVLLDILRETFSTATEVK